MELGLADVFADERVMLTRIAIALFCLSMGFNLWLAAGDPGWLMLPAMLAGWYLADTASGVIHMIMDYRPLRRDDALRELFFWEGSRVSGDYQQRFGAAMKRLRPIERIVYDFKNHHPRPDALGRRSLTRQVGSTILFVTLPESLMLNAAALAFGMPGWLVLALAVMLIGGTFAQYFHGTLHRPDNPWPVTAMRRVGLLMTPQAHEKHHFTLRRDFSTISGWSNPVLNLLFNTLRRNGRLGDDGLVPSGSTTAAE